MFVQPAEVEAPASVPVEDLEITCGEEGADSLRRTLGRGVIGVTAHDRRGVVEEFHLAGGPLGSARVDRQLEAGRVDTAELDRTVDPAMAAAGVVGVDEAAIVVHEAPHPLTSA